MTLRRGFRFPGWLGALALASFLAACGGTGSPHLAADVPPDLSNPGPDVPAVDTLPADPGPADDVPSADAPPADVPVVDVPVADEGTPSDPGVEPDPGTPPADTGAPDEAPADAAADDVPALPDAEPDTGTPTDTALPQDVPPADVPDCPLYHQWCDGACVNTQVSALHCGKCNNPCTGLEACSAGACSATCLEGHLPCSGTCINPRTDGDNCNGCGNTCPEGQGCLNGNCRATVVVGPDPAQCVGGGPAILLPIAPATGEETQCASGQAQTRFTWAVCTCNDLSFANDMFTDAYDSTAAPYAPGQVGGGLGVNGAIATRNHAEVQGSVWASGAAGMNSENFLTIGQELHLAGPFATTGQIRVRGDAYVGGNVSTTGWIVFEEDLTVPAGAAITGDVTVAAQHEAPVEVSPPCQCAPEQLVPVADIVAAHAAPTANDNALIGLDPQVLMDPTGPTHLRLPCGKYYLAGVRTNQPLTIVATGRTALFIDGDFQGTAGVQISLTPDAELDLLVTGTLSTENQFELGSPAYPALVRVYLGGSSLTLSNKASIGAFVHAAKADIATLNDIEVYGGIVAGRLAAANKLKVHYDRAVLSVGQNCPEDPDDPGTPCATCEDCGNQACVDGFCGECSVDADCCPPLICDRGTCRMTGMSF